MPTEADSNNVIKTQDTPAPSSPTPSGQRGPGPASKIARGLGWFSLALGATELIAPGLVARVAGVKGNAPLIRVFGLREIACGAGLLTARRQAPYLWARVAGDVMDVTSVLAATKTTRRPDPVLVGTTLTQLLMIGALDVYTALAVSKTSANKRGSSTPPPDYSTRSGFPRPPDAMRGVARQPSPSPEQ